MKFVLNWSFRKRDVSIPAHEELRGEAGTRYRCGLALSILSKVSALLI